MATVLLRLQGPLQSWGTSSRFDERDTRMEPSKSGVIGLVCAALGRDRSEPIEDLASLQMAVRVDREGILMRDFQTAGGEADSKKKTLMEASGTVVNRTIVSPRFFLADAVFLAGLEGEPVLLQRIYAALRNPVWPLSLGRKSFVPSYPVYLPGGFKVDQPLRESLTAFPRLCPSEGRESQALLRFAFEDNLEGALRIDQPIAPFSERRFGRRFVKTEWIHVSSKVIA